MILADLEAIKARGYRNGATLAEACHLSDAAAADVPALVAEVERLHAALESHQEYHRRMDERERDFYAGDVL